MQVETQWGILTVEGGEQIKPGDTYIAKRNGDWKLLECNRHDTMNQIVFPESLDYCFDTHDFQEVD